MLPVSNVLGGLINAEDGFAGGTETNNYIDHAVRILQYQSLLYLECYFLNVHMQDNDLYGLKLPAATKENVYPRAYMVVRLPQQHIAEEFFDIIALQARMGKRVYANTSISGYSYLVFWINFAKLPENKLPLSIAHLMNWNANYFDLVVKEDPKDCLFNIRKDLTGRNVKFPYVNHYPLGTNIINSRNQFDRNHFPKYAPARYLNPSGGNELVKVDQHFETFKFLVSDPDPVTAIEAPYRLILSPKLPDSTAYQFTWSYSYPVPLPSEKYEAELWMATLKIRKKFRKHIARDGKSEQDKKLKNQGDEQMELMMIGSPDYSRTDSTNYDESEKCSFKKLPCSLDRQDLTYLYLHGGIPAKALSITFTPLGITTNINFRNYAYEKNKSSLFQWNQEISFGRDQKVTVSRIVVDATHGLKMLHIQSTNRETFNGQAVLIYREFLMPLDAEKDFSLYENDNNINQYKDTNWKFNSPIKKVGFKDVKPIEIKPLAKLSEDQKITHPVERDPDTGRSLTCDCANEDKEGNQVVAFWPVTLDGRHLKWDMFFNDWHSNDNEIASNKNEEGKNKIEENRNNYERPLFILTADLTKSEQFEMLYRMRDSAGNETIKSLPEVSEEIFKPITDEQLTDFDQLHKYINDDIQTKVGNHVWMNILRLSEDFELQKTDYYREYLEKVITVIEEKLRAKARNIEDLVIDEWSLFKQRVINSEKHLLSIVSRLIMQLENELWTINKTAIPNVEKLTIINTIQNYKNELEVNKTSVISDIEADYKGALSKILLYKQDVINIVEKHNTLLNQENIVKIFSKYFSSYNDKLSTYERYLNEFRKIENIVDSLGFDWALQAFMYRLPRGYVNAIRRDINNYVQSFNRCIDRIQHIEENLLSKVDMYKAKVGYAVSHMEEELNDLKTKLISEYGVNKWEEKYEELRTLYHKEVNDRISKLETEYIIFRNNYRYFQKDFSTLTEDANTRAKTVFNIYHDYCCCGQLFTSKVAAFRETVNKDIYFKIKYPADYYMNQISNKILETTQNAAMVFAELKADGKELVRSAFREIGSELGGIMNPELAADFLTYAKDIKKEAKAFNDNISSILDQAKEAGNTINDHISDIKKDAADMKREFEGELSKYKDQLTLAKNSLVLISKEAKEAFKTKENEAKAYFENLKAEFFKIKLRDIIGNNAMIPRLERKGNMVSYTFITNNLISPPPNKLFSFIPMLQEQPAAIIVHMEKSIKDPKKYLAWTRISNFTVGIFEERIILGFEKLELHSDERVKNKVSVRIKTVDFQKELAFIKALSKNIKIPGTGLTVSINPTDITVDFKYALPDISGGAFNFFNVKFGVGVIIPFPIGQQSAPPVIAKFGINAADDKFVLGVGIWGGRGHAVVEATPKYIRSIDVGMDYGGLLALNLGIARGQAYLMAGVRYVYKRDDFGESSMELYAIITCGGSVTVFGFITISVVFVLCLKYEKKSSGSSSMYGTCSVSYSIEIGFFKKSFTLTFSKRLHGSDGQSNPEEYGYLPNHLDNDMHDNMAWFASGIWSPPENLDRSEALYHYAGEKETPKQMEDEYDFGQKKLTERFNKAEWRRICRIHKINPLS
jgi:hypothetical protein